MNTARLSFATSIVIHALRQLGGKGSLGEIHEIAAEHPRFPSHTKRTSQWAAIRHVLSTNSSDSGRWSGTADYFRRMGQGIWSLHRSGWLLEDEHLDLGATPARTRWVDFVRRALADLGGEATTVDVWKKTAELRKAAGFSVPSSVAENVWWTMRSHSTGKDGCRNEVFFEQIDQHHWRLLPSAAAGMAVTTRPVHTEGGRPQNG